MDSKVFWSRAANYGLLTGLAVFIVNLCSYVFRLENHAWISEAMLFVVLFGGIRITGRRNVKLDQRSGYTYGQSVGFVFALMLFSAIAAGVGDFLLYAYIAPEYYAEKIDTAIESLAKSGGVAMSNTLQLSAELSKELIKNPFYTIFSEIINLGIKGGFLGLVMSAFLKTEPRIPQNGSDDER